MRKATKFQNTKPRDGRFSRKANELMHSKSETYAEHFNHNRWEKVDLLAKQGRRTGAHPSVMEAKIGIGSELKSICYSNVQGSYGSSFPL